MRPLVSHSNRVPESTRLHPGHACHRGDWETLWELAYSKQYNVTGTKTMQAQCKLPIGAKSNSEINLLHKVTTGHKKRNVRKFQEKPSAENKYLILNNKRIKWSIKCSSNFEGTLCAISCKKDVKQSKNIVRVPGGAKTTHWTSLHKETMTYRSFTAVNMYSFTHRNINIF